MPAETCESCHGSRTPFRGSGSFSFAEVATSLVAVAVSVSLAIASTAARCPAGAWLFDVAGNASVLVEKIRTRDDHGGRGFVVKCKCIRCHKGGGTWYRVLSYARA